MDDLRGLHARADGRRRDAISARSSTGWRSITGTPTIRTSMSWSAAAPTTARTSSSAATTSARAFAIAPPSASPWSWGRAASRRSEPPWRRRSRPSAGPASIARFATSPTTAAASPICVLAAPDEDPELRRLMLGRAAKLERLGLAEQVGPARWTLKPGLEQTLRDLGDPRRHHQDHAPRDDRRGPRAGRVRLRPAWR